MTLPADCERSTTKRDGVFYMEPAEYKTSFSWFNINLASSKMLAQGMKVEGAGSSEKVFKFKLSKDVSEAYFQVDTYGRRMIPDGCGCSSDQVKIMLYKNGSRLTYTWRGFYYGQLFLHRKDLTAGDYEVRVTVTRWKVSFGQEYGFKIISPEDIEFTLGDAKSTPVKLLGDARTDNGNSDSESESESESQSESTSCSGSDCSECSDGSCSSASDDGDSNSQSESSDSNSNSDDNSQKVSYTQDRWNSYKWTNWGSCGACVWYMNKVRGGEQSENMHTTQGTYFKFTRGWYLKSRDSTWNMFFQMENTSDKTFDATIYVGGHVNGPFGSNGSNAYSYQRSCGGFIFRAKKAAMKKGDYLAYMIKVNNEWLETHYDYVEV